MRPRGLNPDQWESGFYSLALKNEADDESPAPEPSRTPHPEIRFQFPAVGLCACV